MHLEIAKKKRKNILFYL